jgi:DNA mismatch endonuclease (patch repair protein)
MAKQSDGSRDPAVTSRIMSAVRAKDTVPELLLRRELHRRGLRYRLHARGLVGKPDLVFASARIAVFVDGDFWHGKGWQERGFASVEAQFAKHRDPQFWIAKIRRNMARDDEVNAALTAAGWRVVRVLESQVRADVVAVADDVERHLRAARSPG